MAPNRFTDQYLAIRQQAGAEMVTSMQIDFVAMVLAALEESGKRHSGMLEYIGISFDAVRSRGRAAPLFVKAHQEVGEAAVRSTAAAFHNRRYKRPTGQYRIGQDRLSGRLGKVLGNTSAHVRASAEQLSVFNVTYMNQEAGHWSRLNYGAGGGGAEGLSPPQQFPMTWSGLLIGTLGLEPNVQPAFNIPKGFWISPNGERAKGYDPANRFYLRGMVKGMGIRGRASHGGATKGIASRNFMDAGIRRISNELPRAYEQLYIDLYNTQRGELERAAQRGSRVVRPSSGVGRQRIGFNYNRGGSRFGGR